MQKVGPTRGLGARYGASVRKRYVDVMVEVKKRRKCPRCGFLSVKRRSVGIWECRKCGFTLAGGAYELTTKMGSMAKRSTSSKG